MFFLDISCFFYDPADFGNLISGSFAFSKTSLNIWKFMVHILLKPGLENFFFFLIIYLAVPGLKCGMQDLPSSLHHVWSSCGLRTLSCGTWYLVPYPGMGPWHPALGVQESQPQEYPGSPQTYSFEVLCFRSPKWVSPG